MSRFQGPQGPGALARHRARKRQEAEQRAERRQVAQNLTALAAQARAATETRQGKKRQRRATAPVTTPRSQP